MLFVCARCGESHDLSELSLGTIAPEQWYLFSDREKARSEIGPDYCAIDSDEGRSFYIRGCLDIPIRGTEIEFTWGVWCSLSDKSFDAVSEHWDDPARTSLGPYFGWLCTEIPGYPDTMFLKTMVHQRPIGVRPYIKLEPTDHPLAVDQREGIDENRLQAIVVDALHPEDAEP